MHVESIKLLLWIMKARLVNINIIRLEYTWEKSATARYSVRQIFQVSSDKIFSLEQNVLELFILYKLTLSI
jgi:hypothetical protein